MQYVRSISGSVSKTWNSINPATLSGAIDVIAVEQQDGSLACSPFHVRFGKVQVLRPSDKKVEFTVNNVKQDFAMKLGEGGEAFFVFETTENIPEGLQTSPLASPEVSPQPLPSNPPGLELSEPEPLDLGITSAAVTEAALEDAAMERPAMERSQSDQGDSPTHASSLAESRPRPASSDYSTKFPSFQRSITEADAPPSAKTAFAMKFGDEERSQSEPPGDIISTEAVPLRPSSPPLVSKSEAVTRAINLSKKLWSSNIPTQVTERGDLMLDMTGYKSSEEQALRAEVIARKLLSEELEGDYDIGALIGVDEKGNIWIYSSEEAKEAANRKAELSGKLGGLQPAAMRSTDAISDPGYHSDDTQEDEDIALAPCSHQRHDSDSAVGLYSTPHSPEPPSPNAAPIKSYAKTLRLTSDQLQKLNLHPGANTMSFTVNRAICQAYIYLWSHSAPIVISDIDGTITKSDVMGHVMTAIGRDYTHLGVAKLYTDIVSNGYNIFYLTSRSVGQADTTRGYLSGIVQEGYKLPRGPVIMSPDRTFSALRREVYLRKPEVFKMACLRDIMGLFNLRETPFYAGFGNRFTDALSYRSVNIPQTRIFTINSNAEVSLDLVSLNRYKTGYVSMRELVDHFFPPVSMLIKEGGEDFTDFNYWREQPLRLEDFSASESEDSSSDQDEGEGTLRSEDDYGDLDASYLSQRDSIDEGAELGESSILETVEGGEEELEAAVLSDGQGGLLFAEPEEDDGGILPEEELEALDLSNGRTPRPTIVSPSEVIKLNNVVKLDNQERRGSRSDASVD